MDRRTYIPLMKQKIMGGLEDSLMLEGSLIELSLCGPPSLQLHPCHNGS